MPSEFIPNSFQTPNAYVDRFMAYLTPEEWKVLSYFVRRIFGFQKREDRLSYSQVMDGYEVKGIKVDHGTGLGMAAVENAIKSMMKYRLIIRVEGNDPLKNEGALFALQMESDLVDLPGLIERETAKQEREKARMSKAREARLSNNPTPNGLPHPYPITPPPPYPITGGVPLSNNGHNNQGNTDLKPESSSLSGVGKFIDAAEAENIYRKVTGFMSMPTLGRDDAIRIICDIAREKGEETAAYLEPYYLAWGLRRNRDGRFYSKSSFGWLDWAAAGAIPEEGSGSAAQPTSRPRKETSNDLTRAFEEA